MADRSALGVVEAEVHRRAIEGVDHPVIYKGEITDTYKEFSDNLLMFRAKRLDPSYRDNYVGQDKGQQVAVTKIIINLAPRREATSRSVGGTDQVPRSPAGGGRGIPGHSRGG